MIRDGKFTFLKRKEAKVLWVLAGKKKEDFDKEEIRRRAERFASEQWKYERYEKRAKQNNINVKISARAGKELGIMPQDLVIVIANLFENAINGAEKAKNKDKTIDIYIKESTQRLLIKMENSCKSNLDFEESLYGVGIRSVIATTTKYEGMYDFLAENGVFSAKISLNLS